MMLNYRDINLRTKVHTIKALVFPVAMYEYESWTIKVKHKRIEAFKLWCWRRVLRVPWIPKRSNQSILKEINSEYSLEGLMLKLELQNFGHLMGRADSLGKIEGRWPRGWRFSFSISPSSEYSELISFRIDWFDLIAVQGTLQHHSSKASILQHSASS